MSDGRADPRRAGHRPEVGVLASERRRLAISEETRRAEAALRKIANDYAEHGTWRCYSDRYPGECLCGLDELLGFACLPTDAERGLDPAWRGFRSPPHSV